MLLKVHAGDWGEVEAGIGPGWGGGLKIFLSKGGLFSGHDKYFLEKDIDSLEIATEENVKNLGGAVGWGVAGGLLLGPAGLLAGLLLGGRSKKKVTFICVFKDGKKILATADEKTFNTLNISAMRGQFVDSKT